MLSPFPGMDPYLEDPRIWADFHAHLVSRLSVALNQGLPRPYYAHLEMRSELAIEIQTEPFLHRFVEIRDSSHGHKLITLIEIMSPSNKRRGPDRDAYDEKREEILDSDASLIEIDFLRAGMRAIESPSLEKVMPDLGGESSSYFVLVNRGWRRTDRATTYQVFAVGLRDLLPCIPVPLKESDLEPVLDLQYVFNQVYEGGPYARGAVDYTEPPPDPPLGQDDAAWALSLTNTWLARLL